MGSLHSYFGAVGIASVVMWILAALLLIVSIPMPRVRTVACYAALLLAVVGIFLARINSNNVSAIEVDRTEELKEAAERQRSMRKTVNATDYQSQIHFVEESPSAAATKPAAAGAPAGQGDYSYKTAGKQKREANKKREDGIVEDMGSTATTQEATEAQTRKMPEADVIRANTFDRINLTAVRFTLLAAIVFVVVDYLRRLNTTNRAYLPLPVSGRAVDSVFPKTHSVFVQTSNRSDVQRYLESVIRKGESFLYFGSTDFWPKAHSIGRLKILSKRFLALPKTTIQLTSREIDDESAFESAWMGRACVVLIPSGDSGFVIGDLLSYLQRRYVPGAPVRKTVSVVWDLPTSLPPDVVRKLVRFAREVHLKLVIVSPKPPSDDLRPLFEEIIGAGRGASSHPTPPAALAAAS